MSKSFSWITLVLLSVGLGALSFFNPCLLGDEGNGFLKNFVNHEFLAFLGVVVTITLASAASLHMELNRLEDAADKEFPETRGAVRVSAYSLIVLLTAGFCIVLTKPFIEGSEMMTSLWNSSAIIVVVFNIFVLADLTMTVLAIPSIRELKKRNGG